MTDERAWDGPPLGWPMWAYSCFVNAWIRYVSFESRHAAAPVEAAAIAFEQAQQVMLAQMDVAHDVIMPVTAPTHMTLGSRW
jgi:hypothetical protein